MESISGLVLQLQEKIKQQGIPKKRGTEWTDLVQKFQDEINDERFRTCWKPVTFMAVRYKVEHLDTQTLYWFLSVCRDYKARNGSFGKCFFGSLKVK